MDATKNASRAREGSKVFSRERHARVCAPTTSTCADDKHVRAMNESWMLAPEYLGTHTVAMNEEEISLDKGALKLWCGAAMHNDVLAAEIEAKRRAKSAGGCGGGLDGRPEEVFSVASASGSRLIGGPFLRARAATVPDALLHVWLSPLMPDGKPALPEAADAASESAVHAHGPYRVRVLASEIVTGAGDDASLQQVETLQVTVAVDRQKLPPSPPPPPLALTELLGRTAAPAAAPPSEAAPSGIARLPLPAAGQDATFWLSTQGSQHVVLAHPPAAAAPAAGCDAEAGGADTAAESSPRLPSLAPPLAAAPSEPTSIEVSLHAAPLRSLPKAAAPFGCAPWVWSAELTAFAVGEAEAHLSLPLRPFRPEEAQAAGAAAAPRRLGPFTLHVLQCTGHFVQPADTASEAGVAAGAAAGEAVSEYPMLLLHAQLRISRGEEEGEAEEDLGSALERLLE